MPCCGTASSFTWCRGVKPSASKLLMLESPCLARYLSTFATSPSWVRTDSLSPSTPDSSLFRFLECFLSFSLAFFSLAGFMLCHHCGVSPASVAASGISDSLQKTCQLRPVIVVMLKYTSISTAHDSQHQEDLGRWVKARVSGRGFDVACIHVQAEFYYRPAVVLQLKKYQRETSLLCVLSCFGHGRRRAWRALKVVGHAPVPTCS